ncbi:hypothetical protein E2C01_038044 [Portunus trituberculatus]|uniref:Uncharacterized protein n=1 Tax=Portunus trituberculatus TaxID=210409 RepID=A0A5B7FD46_PORTR|nr:hypothetical protein [Portunus trituberculatus]
MKIRNLVRVQVFVRHSTPLVDSQESHQEKSYDDIFMDGDSSSPPFSPPLLSCLSPVFTYVSYTIVSKHPSTSSQESDYKKSRKTATIEKKFEVFDHYAWEEKTMVTVHVTGLRESTLCIIRANKMRMEAFTVFMT